MSLGERRRRTILRSVLAALSYQIEQNSEQLKALSLNFPALIVLRMYLN